MGIGFLVLGTSAADWEEDMVQKSMMLNLKPIAHVLRMKEIIPASRRTDVAVLLCTMMVCKTLGLH